jgi:hypothetical protein
VEMGMYGSSPQMPAGAPLATRAGHSGLGIVSFVIALVSGLIVVVSVTVATVLAMKGAASGPHPLIAFVGLLIIAGVMLSFVGLALGIAGCIQRTRKRLFATLGLCLNAFIVLGVVALLALGVAVRVMGMR